MSPLNDAQISWYSGAHNFDRRPAVLLNFPETDGSRWGAAGNPEGLRKWWRQRGANTDGTPKADLPTYEIDGEHPDQFIALVDQLELLYETYGFRRFVLYMPAGSYFGREQFDQGALNTPTLGSYFMGEDVPFNQWTTMPEWKRSQFQLYSGIFREWCRDHSDATFELYMGSAMVTDSQSLLSHPYYEMFPASRSGETPVTGPLPELREVTIGYDHLNGTLDEITAPRWIPPSNYNIVESEIAFDPRDPTHLFRLVQDVKPWMDCGVKMFWLDAGVIGVCPSGPDKYRRRFGLDEITYNPWFAGRHTRFGGENIPAGNSHSFLEFCSLERTAYMELDSEIYKTVRYFDAQGHQDIPTYRFADRIITPPNPCPVLVNETNPIWTPDSPNPETECHYLVANLIQVGANRLCFEEVSKLEQVGRARLRGYVCSPYFSKWDYPHAEDPEQFDALRLVQRWYSMGYIHIADFDGDGDADANDSSEFTKALVKWNDVNGTSLANRRVVVFAMGDVDGNKKINNDDIIAFQQAMASAVSEQNLGPKVFFKAPRGL